MKKYWAAWAILGGLLIGVALFAALSGTTARDGGSIAALGDTAEVGTQKTISAGQLTAQPKSTYVVACSYTNLDELEREINKQIPAPWLYSVFGIRDVLLSHDGDSALISYNQSDSKATVDWYPKHLNFCPSNPVYMQVTHPFPADTQLAFLRKAGSKHNYWELTSLRQPGEGEPAK